MSLLILLTTTGCLPTMSASILAIIEDSSGNPIAEPNIEIRSWDGTLVSEITGASDGSFTADLPPFQEFFVVASKEGYPPASFTGYSGEGAYSVPSGTLWLRTESEVDTALADFGDCYSPEGSSGGVIEGLAKLFISGELLDNLPTITTATAEVTLTEDTGIDGCYTPELSDDGAVIPSENTGDSGRYAVFNVDEGAHELVVTLDVEGSTYEYPYLVYVPEDGVTPMIPTLIPFLEQ